VPPLIMIISLIIFTEAGSEIRIKFNKLISG